MKTIRIIWLDTLYTFEIAEEDFETFRDCFNLSVNDGVFELCRQLEFMGVEYSLQRL